MTQMYVLFEHAVGYCLFKVREFEEIGSFIPQVEEAANDPSKFQKVVNLAAFKTFKNAAAALENMNSVSEGILSNDLSAFLQSNMPNPGKKSKILLGVSDPKLGAAISETLEIPVTQTGVVPEIIRGIRFHLTHFIKGLNPASMKQTELGLGHSYSRGKVKFNVNRVDNNIIQSIALVDQLDKDINTFSMRIREWYSYHFPELSKVVTDNYQYALCACFIRNRNLMNNEMHDKLEEITSDSAKAQAILDAGRMSMGMDISPIDLLNIEIFAERVIKLAEYRKGLAEYLKNRMNDVAPNLSALIGEIVGARLISHAGSLTNLAKYPASTVQILGAEKALFRALKTKGKTPKYGLIFHSSFIGKAGSTNKGRISRYLANKCTLASRIDCFSEVQTNIFGQKLKGQVEERLKFYESGELPRKNVDVMAEAVVENGEVIKNMEKKENKKKKKLETREEPSTGLNGSVIETSPVEGEEETPHKKKKKRKSVATDDAEENEGIEVAEGGSAKKKRKKSQGEAMETSMNNSQIEDVVEGGSAKKKRKKSQGEAMETSMNNSQIEDNGDIETSAKKKKKRKSMEVEAGETSLNNSAFDTSQVEEEEGELKKKKKKKKKHQEEGEEEEETVEASVDISMNNSSVEIVEGETPKKKKKNKRKSHVEES